MIKFNDKNFLFIVFIFLILYKIIFPASFFVNLLFLFYFFILIYLKIKNKSIKKFLNFIFGIGFFIFSLSLGVILKDIYVNKNFSPKCDYIIILGAALKGDEPTDILKIRLNKGVEYFQKYPETIFVVSGGQGAKELVSESYAMKKYLVSQGVSEKNIIEENRSSSTLENLKFSLQYIPKNKSIGIISNDYHIYRAKFFGKQLGVTLIGIYAPTPIISALSQYTREIIAIIFYKIKTFIQINL